VQDGTIKLPAGGESAASQGSDDAEADAHLRDRIRTLIAVARELSDACADLADALRPLPGNGMDDPLTMDFSRLAAERTAALLDEAASETRGTLGLLGSAYAALGDEDAAPVQARPTGAHRAASADETAPPALSDTGQTPAPDRFRLPPTDGSRTDSEQFWLAENGATGSEPTGGGAADRDSIGRASTATGPAEPVIGPGDRFRLPPDVAATVDPAEKFRPPAPANPATRGWLDASSPAQPGPNGAGSAPPGWPSTVQPPPASSRPELFRPQAASPSGPVGQERFRLIQSPGTDEHEIDSPTEPPGARPERFRLVPSEDDAPVDGDPGPAAGRFRVVPPDAAPEPADRPPDAAAPGRVDRPPEATPTGRLQPPAGGADPSRTDPYPTGLTRVVRPGNGPWSEVPPPAAPGFRSPATGQTPAGGQTRAGGQTPTTDRSPAGDADPNRFPSPATGQAPATGQPPGGAQTPIAGRTPTDQAPTTGQSPVGGQTPAWNADPNRFRSPATGQTPATGQPPAGTQTPIAGRTPTDQAPTTGQSPVGGQTPAWNADPSRFRSPATGQTPATGQAPAGSQAPPWDPDPNRFRSPATGQAPAAGFRPVSSGQRQPPPSQPPPAPAGQGRFQPPDTGQTPAMPPQPRPTGETPAAGADLFSVRGTGQTPPAQPFQPPGTGQPPAANASPARTAGQPATADFQPPAAGRPRAVDAGPERFAAFPTGQTPTAGNNSFQPPATGQTPAASPAQPSGPRPNPITGQTPASRQDPITGQPPAASVDPLSRRGSGQPPAQFRPPTTGQVPATPSQQQPRPAPDATHPHTTIQTPPAGTNTFQRPATGPAPTPTQAHATGQTPAAGADPRSPRDTGQARFEPPSTGQITAASPAPLRTTGQAPPTRDDRFQPGTGRTAPQPRNTGQVPTTDPDPFSLRDTGQTPAAPQPRNTGQMPASAADRFQPPPRTEQPPAVGPPQARTGHTMPVGQPGQGRFEPPSTGQTPAASPDPFSLRSTGQSAASGDRTLSGQVHLPGRPAQPDPAVDFLRQGDERRRDERQRDERQRDERQDDRTQNDGQQGAYVGWPGSESTGTGVRPAWVDGSSSTATGWGIPRPAFPEPEDSTWPDAFTKAPRTDAVPAQDPAPRLYEAPEPTGRHSGQVPVVAYPVDEPEQSAEFLLAPAEPPAPAAPATQATPSAHPLTAPDLPPPPDNPATPRFPTAPEIPAAPAEEYGTALPATAEPAPRTISALSPTSLPDAIANPPALPPSDPGAYAGLASLARQVEAARRHLQAAVVVAHDQRHPAVGDLLGAVERVLDSLTELSRGTRESLPAAMANQVFPGEARFLCSMPWEHNPIVAADPHGPEPAGSTGLCRLLLALGYEAQLVTGLAGASSVQIRTDRYAAHVALVEPAGGGRQRWSGALEWTDADGITRTWAETLGPVELDEEELARRTDELLRRCVGPLV
jgi:hypothetical protein